MSTDDPRHNQPESAPGGPGADPPPAQPPAAPPSSSESHGGNGQVDPEALRRGHEYHDVSVRGIGWFVFYFVLGMAVIQVAVWFGLRVYYRHVVAGEIPRSALAPQQVSPPAPQLQPSVSHETLPYQDMQALRAKFDNELHSYAWVDRSKGLVRIPIDRAMSLVAQQLQKQPTSRPAPRTDANAQFNAPAVEMVLPPPDQEFKP